MPASTKVMEILEEFDADNIATSAADGIRWLVSSDSGDTAFGPGANLGGITARATISASDNRYCEIGHGLLAWRVQDGYLNMEARCQLDVITNVACSIGFNDDILEDSNTLPVELSGTAFTSNSGTFVGLVFDTDATNDDFHLFWVDADSDNSEPIADLRFSNIAPIAGEWFVINVSLTDRGSGLGARATVHIDTEGGLTAEKSFNTSIARGTLLTPHIGVENRSTAGVHIMDIDYIYVSKSREAA